jgi:hypothetical protein
MSLNELTLMMMMLFLLLHHRVDCCSEKYGSVKTSVDVKNDAKRLRIATRTALSNQQANT